MMQVKVCRDSHIYFEAIHQIERARMRDQTSMHFSFIQFATGHHRCLLSISQTNSDIEIAPGNVISPILGCFLPTRRGFERRARWVRWGAD